MVEASEPVIGQPNTQNVNTRHAGGRPPKLTPEQRLEVYEAFESFITDTDDSRISKFVSYDKTALQYNITHDNLIDWVEFSELRKRAIRKQEDYLLEKGGTGKYNPTLAIFRLKQPQHGYRDRQETDITTNGNDVGLGISAEQAEQLIKARAARTDI
jgi:hypothetical protein